MRSKLNPRVKTSRVKHPFADDRHGNDFNAAYVLKAPTGNLLTVLVSDGDGWDHVSVSVRNASVTPTWEEMCFVKDAFFAPEECVIQYHPPARQYVNVHDYCLHLWRKQGEAFPVPPMVMV